MTAMEGERGWRAWSEVPGRVDFPQINMAPCKGKIGVAVLKLPSGDFSDPEGNLAAVLVASEESVGGYLVYNMGTNAFSMRQCLRGVLTANRPIDTSTDMCVSNYFVLRTILSSCIERSASALSRPTRKLTVCLPSPKANLRVW